MALKSLEIGDTITSQITVTNGYHDGGVGTLAGSNYTTSSLSSTQKKYYYNIQYNSKDHFSVTYGHKAGSGSSVQTATTEGETKAVYKQFYNITETDSERLRDTTGWLMVDGTNSTNAVTQSDVYVVVAERLQMKDRLNPGTWTMKLSGSITGTANKATSSFLTLTDNSKTVAPSSAPFGERYDIVSGSAGSVVVAASTKTYGFFYPDAGMMVFSANALSSSLPGRKGFIQSGSEYAKSGTGGNGFAQDLRTVSAADNANKMRIALQKGSVTLRSEEQQYIFDHFCRARANEYNLSQNITFWSGSNYKIRHSDMVTNPQVYISEVGLYDSAGSLMAVGKLSSAINKNFSSEAIIKVRLTY